MQCGHRVSRSSTAVLLACLPVYWQGAQDYLVFYCALKSEIIIIITIIFRKFKSNYSLLNI